jgi:DNA-binding CsgD family transcriptional regulator
MPTQSRRSYKFIGRRNELEVLKKSLDLATENGLKGLVLSGDFGVGRSTLLSKLRAVAHQRQYSVVDVRLCGAGGQWERFRGADDNGRATTVPIAEPVGDTLEVISKSIRQGPLLLTADDACRADARSLEALRQVLEESVQLPVFAVVSVQRGLPPRAPAELARLVYDMDRMALEGLSEQETSALVRSVLPRRTGAEFTTVCHRLTAGNPFMLMELLDWMAGPESSARTEPTLSRVPMLSAVADAVARRLDPVDPAIVSVATLIAATGEDDADALPLIAHLSGLPLEQTLAAADLLVRTGFVSDDGTIALRHRLLCEALAGRLTSMARSAAHLGAATYLYQHKASIQRTAQHLVASSVRSDDPWSVDVLLEAARGAARAGDYDAALGFTEHARCTADGTQRLRAVLMACDVRLLADWQQGVEELVATLTELPEEDSRVLLLRRLGTALSIVPPHPTGTARALAGARAATAGSALARWDRLHRITSQFFVRPLTHTADQLDAVVTQGPGTVADEPPAAASFVLAVDSLKALCMDLGGQDTAEAVRHARHALNGWAQTPSPHPVAVPAALSVLVQNGLFDEAANQMRVLQARDAISLQPDPVMLMLDVQIALGQGTTDTAQRGLQNLLRILPPYESQPLDPIRASAVGLLAQLLAERGQGEEAWKVLNRYHCTGELDQGWQYGHALTARAGLRADSGDLISAARDLTELRLRNAASGVRATAALAWRRNGVSLLWRTGLFAEAREAAAEQMRIAEKADLPLELGRALRAQARTHGGPRAEQQLQEAIGLLRTADGTGDFDLACAQADLGALLMRLGEPDRAVPALVEAAELALRCGVPPVADQAMALLESLGERRAPYSSLRGVLRLTARERQIVLMAAHGSSNRRIAEALDITRRTVELHLSSAYRKLDISGRRDFPALLRVPGVDSILAASAAETIAFGY